ncbi:MAG: DUF892 family protein [Acetobacteraceae bacterium]|nr:DUF892 family protein [Acetobacteraceae bacterium]
MPRMMRHATAQPLKHAIQMHIEQTEGRIERLERALDQLGAPPAASCARACAA